MKYCILIICSLLTGVWHSTIFAASDKDSHVLIFASFSMPKESLQALSVQAKQIDAPIIMRGLVNNSFKETVNKITEFNLQEIGIQIDPLLFKKFNIQKIPAIVVTNNISCPPNQTCLEQFDVLYGNIPLSYALKVIVHRDDFVSSLAEEALHKMQVNHA